MVLVGNIYIYIYIYIYMWAVQTHAICQPDRGGGGGVDWLWLAGCLNLEIKKTLKHLIFLKIPLVFVVHDFKFCIQIPIDFLIF